MSLADHSKKAASDSKVFRLRPVCSQNRAGSYIPDLISHIRFGSVLPKKARIVLCKTDPDPVWKAWSGFGQMHLVQKQAGVQELSDPVLVVVVK